MRLKKKLRESKVRDESSNRSRTAADWTLWLAVALMAALLPAAHAQYPGHIDTSKKTGQSLRAIAIVEWTGQPGRPSASRIIPLCVFDGEAYQPGGLYLARPEPLALERGTEYVLQHAGIPNGLYDVSSARDIRGYWIGYGTWRPLVPETAKKLPLSKNLPQIATGSDEDRPHFKSRSGTTQNGNQDQNRKNEQPGSSSPSIADSSQNSGMQAVPDRPALRRSLAPESRPSVTPPSPETAITGTDPDRPRLSYKSYNSTSPQFEAVNLTGDPADLQQIIGVSDAVDRELHSLHYFWSGPAYAAKMQMRMEALTQKTLAAAPSLAQTPAGLKSRPASSAAAHQERKASPAATPPYLLTDERFEAYELSYGEGATIVFSAQTTGAAGKTRYVTLIAQPDFYGAPRVIFQSVTDDENLGEEPRMRLVDAVDARANNRGDLVFELRSRHDRQFAMYEVTGGQVRQIFTTGPLQDANAGS